MRNTHTGKATLPVLSNVGDLENIGIIVRGCESAVVGSVWRVRVSAIWLDVCNQIPSSLHLPDDPFLARRIEIIDVFEKWVCLFIKLNSYAHFYGNELLYTGNLVVLLDLNYIEYVLLYDI